MGEVKIETMGSSAFSAAALAMALFSVGVVEARLLSGNDLLPTGRRQTADNGIPMWYPGRPTGICTSRGHTCSSIMTNKPYHVLAAGRCMSSLTKIVKDRFGRPLTIRFQYNKQTLIANREQVCDIRGHIFSENRSLISDEIDDIIWKNLSIWAGDREHMWPTKAHMKQYLVCHGLFAGFHCSSMFPNCTAEYVDQKPSLPCKELCEEVVEQCPWSEDWDFLPYKLDCATYPSKNDPYRSCTELKVMDPYMKRVASAPRSSGVSILAALVTCLAVIWLDAVP